jgi:enterochelin esterase family protein
MMRISWSRGLSFPILSLAAGVVAFAGACSSSTTDAPQTPNAGSGGMAVGNSGAPGAGNSGVAGSSGGAAAGTAGAAVGGSSGAMTGGTGGVAGGAGGAGAGAGGVAQGGEGGGGAPAGGAQGMQADPGIEGDGMATQDAPYDAPAESLSRLNGAPEGTVTGPLKYASPAIYPGLMFKYYTYVPAQYEPGKPAAFMVFMDDALYVDRGDAPFHGPFVFDNLIHEGSMPVTIVLFVGPGTATGDFDFNSMRLDREAQYSKYNDTWTNFLIQEIIPNVITNSYDIVNDPNGWGIGGQSSGGNCSLIVGMHAPDKFRKILTDNGTFDNADRVDDNTPGTAFPAAITNSPVLPLRIAMLSGPNDIPVTYQYNVDVVAALEAKGGYHYRYIEGSGGHYPPSHAIADFPDELRWLWRGYTLPWYAP